MPIDQLMQCCKYNSEMCCNEQKVAFILPFFRFATLIIARPVCLDHLNKMTLMSRKSYLSEL